MSESKEPAKAEQKVVNAKGDLVAMPTGRWQAKVNEDGTLARQDGHLIKA